MASIIVIRVDFDHAILKIWRSAPLLLTVRGGVVDVVSSDEEAPFVNVIRRILATYFKAGMEEIRNGGQPTFYDGGNIISVKTPTSCDAQKSYI